MRHVAENKEKDLNIGYNFARHTSSVDLWSAICHDRGASTSSSVSRDCAIEI